MVVPDVVFEGGGAERVFRIKVKEPTNFLRVWKECSQWFKGRCGDIWLMLFQSSEHGLKCLDIRHFESYRLLIVPARYKQVPLAQNYHVRCYHGADRRRRRGSATFCLGNRVVGCRARHLPASPP